MEVFDFDRLRLDVVDVGLCTGCGGCAAVCPTNAIAIRAPDPEPVLVGNCNACGLCYKICPGKDIPMSQIERMLFGRKRSKDEDILGINKLLLIGHAINPEIRKSGAGGGIVSALLVFMLEKGFIDGAIVAGFDEEKPWISRPKVAMTAEEIRAAAQSKMTMVPSVSVLKTAVEDHKLSKIGFVGLPCHLHAIRKMQFYKVARNLTEKISICIGLLCGLNCYFRGTERLIENLFPQTAIEDITEIQYRGGKWPGYFIVKCKDGRVRSVPFTAEPGEYAKFIDIAYLRDRCRMCLDYAAEVADLAVGDAGTINVKEGEKWVVKKVIKEYGSIVVRTENGLDIIRHAEEEGYIKTEQADRLLAGAARPLHAGLECKKYANPFFIKERKKHGWAVPNVY